MLSFIYPKPHAVVVVDEHVDITKHGENSKYNTTETAESETKGSQGGNSTQEKEIKKNIKHFEENF